MNILNIMVPILTGACHSETATVTLHCLTKHIKELLPVVKRIVDGFCFSRGRIGNCQAKHEAKVEGKS